MLAGVHGRPLVNGCSVADPTGNSARTHPRRVETPGAVAGQSWYGPDIMASPLGYLESLVRETHKTEAEVVALAFETGLRQLWREQILGRYLRGEIPRNEAIEAVGIDWVELAERQNAAAREDLAWAREK